MATLLYWTLFVSGAEANNKCPCPRTSVCPLSDGCEPLCNTGAGLPDDCGGPDAAGGGGCREAAQRHLSQPGLPAAAPRPRHEPGKGEEETTTGTDTVNTHTHKATNIKICTQTHTYCHRGRSAQESRKRWSLWMNRKPVALVNQVWPNLYIGDE